jgi:hypothetical protein
MRVMREGYVFRADLVSTERGFLTELGTKTRVGMERDVLMARISYENGDFVKWTLRFMSGV